MFETMAMLLKRKSDLQEFVVFSFVGASGFVVELVFFNLFVFLHVPVYLAAFLAMPIAASSNWLLNRQFTFKSANKNRPAIQWSKYLLISAVGWGFNLALFGLGYSVLRLNRNIAKIAATFLVWFWNYFANKFWTFKA